VIQFSLVAWEFCLRLVSPYSWMMMTIAAFGSTTLWQERNGCYYCCWRY